MVAESRGCQAVSFAANRAGQNFRHGSVYLQALLRQALRKAAGHDASRMLRRSLHEMVWQARLGTAALTVPPGEPGTHRPQPALGAGGRPRPDQVWLFMVYRNRKKIDTSVF